MIILSVILWLMSLAASIFILVEAFRDEIWKGVVGLLCGLYLLYWACFEWEHEHKWLVILVWIAFGCGAGGVANGQGMGGLGG